MAKPGLTEMAGHIFAWAWRALCGLVVLYFAWNCAWLNALGVLVAMFSVPATLKIVATKDRYWTDLVPLVLTMFGYIIFITGSNGRVSEFMQEVEDATYATAALAIRVGHAGPVDEQVNRARHACGTYVHTSGSLKLIGGVMAVLKPHQILPLDPLIGRFVDLEPPQNLCVRVIGDIERIQPDFFGSDPPWRNRIPACQSTIRQLCRCKGQ